RDACRHPRTARAPRARAGRRAHDARTRPRTSGRLRTSGEVTPVDCRDAVGPHAEPSHLRVERLAGDAEAPGRGGLGGLLAQALPDERDLDAGEDAVEGFLVCRGISVADAVRQVVTADALSLGHAEDEPVDLVLQLAHVP